MKNSSIAIVISLLAALIIPHNISAGDSISDNGSCSVGLVLSGGGAKGIAHIGVIQALEDNNIPIDYITGTSMGAIVGGLYASGYTPDEMMELLLSKDFARWSTGKIDEKLTYYFYKKEPTPAMLNVSIPTRGNSGSKSILPASLISPLPMNFAFMELFAAHTAQSGGNFDNLFVPFRCVTSDVYRKRKIVCRSGSLGNAIRASMSFPVVFHPIEMDSVPVFDGGIYDNFPVDVMRHDFAPDIMIGVDVSSPDPKPQDSDLLNQLETMIIQNNDYSLPPEEGIKLRIHLEKFSLLDFPKAREIYRIGYDYAMSMMDSICSRITTRVPAEERRLRRAVFKSATPYIRFDSVRVTGGTEKQNLYFRNIFTAGRGDTIELAEAKSDYYRAITGWKLRNLVPTAVYDPSDGLFDLDLKASVKDDLNVGFGGFITSSTNSMVFLTGSYNSLSLSHFEATANAWIGQSYMAAQATARILTGGKHPKAMSLDAVVSRMNYNSSDRFFYEENPTYVSDMQAFGRIGFAVAPGRNSKMEFSAGFGHIENRFFPTTVQASSKTEKNSVIQNLGQARIMFVRNTLDNNFYPTAGAYYRGTAEGMIGKYHYTSMNGIVSEEEINTPWARAEFNFRNYINFSPAFSLGLEANILASTRSLPNTYDQATVTADEFYPSPASYNSFNPKFRAISYGTAGIVPIWKMADNMQLRGTAHVFMPARELLCDNLGKPYYGGWFPSPSLFFEVAGVYNFPFASLSIYGNYTDSTSRKWGCGISFGLFFLAPNFL